MPAAVNVVTLLMAEHCSGEETGHTCDYSVSMTKDTAQMLEIWMFMNKNTKTHIHQGQEVFSNQETHSGAAQLRKGKLIQANVAHSREMSLSYWKNNVPAKTICHFP